MANSRPEPQFFKYWKVFFTLSAAMTFVAVIVMVVRAASSESRSPLNLGVDFTGGSTYILQASAPVSTGELREKLHFLKKEPVIQTTPGEKPDIIIRTPPLTSEERQQIGDLIKQSGWEVKEQVEVGPAFSRDLVVNAVIAVIISSMLILTYLAIRFRFAYAIGAIMALVHDALIVLGVFSLFQIEVNTPFVAAMLTILGYSVNDTIINFDRIRENLKLYPRMDLVSLVNKSIVQVLSRTVNTAGTTLATVFAVLFLGGTTLKTFMLALAIGFFSGIYSSWFVATPVVVIFDLLSQRAARAQRAALAPDTRKPIPRTVSGKGAPDIAPSPSGSDRVGAISPSTESDSTRKRKKKGEKKKPRRR